MNLVRRAILDLRIWWIEVRIEACTDADVRERLGALWAQLDERKWGLG